MRNQIANEFANSPLCSTCYMLISNLSPLNTLDSSMCVWERVVFHFQFFFQTEGRHVSAKAHEAIDHLQCLCQVERRFHCRESNRQPLPWDSGISHHHPIVWGHLGPMRGRSHRSVPTSSVSIPDVKVRNVVGHHLFLKIIPNNFIWLGPNGKFVWSGHERECWGQGHSPCIRICICTFTSAMHMWMHGSAPLNLTFLKCGWKKFQECKTPCIPSIYARNILWTKDKQL